MYVEGRSGNEVPNRGGASPVTIARSMSPAKNEVASVNEVKEKAPTKVIEGAPIGSVATRIAADKAAAAAKAVGLRPTGKSEQKPVVNRADNSWIKKKEEQQSH